MTLASARQPTAPSFSTSHADEILVVTCNLPADFRRASHGIFQRLRMFIDALAPLCERLHLFFFVASEADASEANRRRAEQSLREHWSIAAHVTLCPFAASPSSTGIWSHYIEPVWRGPRSMGLDVCRGPIQQAALSAALARKPRLVFAHRLEVMRGLIDAGAATGAPIAFDMDDLEHVKFARSIARMEDYGRGTPLLHLQRPTLKRIEGRAARAAARAFLCSQDDAATARAAFAGGRFEVIPNSVALPAAPAPVPPEAVLLFVGFFGYDPNRDAVDWFVTDIWPRITRSAPTARLEVVGDRSERLRTASSPPAGIAIRGFVDDIGKAYRDAAIVVCPIQVAGGTRIKLLEAAAHGRAIVSTTIGAEGLGFQHETHALLADTPQAFADACARLIADPALAQRLGNAAREFVAGRYARPALLDRIQQVVRPLLNRSTTASETC